MKDHILIPENSGIILSDGVPAHCGFPIRPLSQRKSPDGKKFKIIPGDFFEGAARGGRSV